MWRDRVDAGRALADRLREAAGPDTIVLGIPRGGVIVAAEVAELLKLPLGVLITRKLGAPGNPELGIGAIAPDGETVVDEGMLRYLQVSDEYLAEEKARQLDELRRRERQYHGGETAPDWTGQTLILVDDGIATGATIKAAGLYARRRGAKRVIIAAPIAPSDTAERLSDAADGFVFLDTPDFFQAVGAFYHDFSQTTDEEVLEALAAR
jgi:putative phosphoribosyl transferase